MIKICKEHAEFIENNIDKIKVTREDIFRHQSIIDIDRGVIQNHEIITHFIILLTYFYGVARVPTFGPPIDENYIRDIISQTTHFIKEAKPKRSVVKNKVYNYDQNLFEYELENGDYINCEKPTMHRRVIPLEIFPLEFIKHYDLALFRKLTIEQIAK